MDFKLNDLSQNDIRVGAYIENTVRCQKEFMEKNAEYGKTWLLYRIQSLMKRIENKALRVRSIQDKGNQYVGDSIESEFDAMYNYAIIGLIVTETLRQDSFDILPNFERESDVDLKSLFDAQQNKCFDLFKKKDHDYDGAWVNMPISTIVDEILVKLARAKPLLKNKNDIKLDDFKEKIFNVLADVANYSIFASILISVHIDPLI